MLDPYGTPFIRSELDRLAYRNGPMPTVFTPHEQNPHAKTPDYTLMRAASGILLIGPREHLVNDTIPAKASYLVLRGGLQDDPETLQALSNVTYTEKSAAITPRRLHRKQPEEISEPEVLGALVAARQFGRTPHHPIYWLQPSWVSPYTADHPPAQPNDFPMKRLFLRTLGHTNLAGLGLPRPQ